MIQLLLSLLVAPLLRRLAGRGDALAPRRVLVIQMAKIGDLLCSMPVLRELKRRHPAAAIDVLAGPQAEPLLRACPYVERVLQARATDFKGIAGKLALVRRLRSGRYDAVVCLNASVTYAVASLWALIPVRIAVRPNFCGRSCRMAMALWTLTEEHRGDRLIQHTYLALLRHMGVHSDNVAKEVFLTPGAEHKAAVLLGTDHGTFVGLGVSSANKLKELGTEKLAAIADDLLRRHPALRVVLIGSADDQQQASAVLRSLARATRVIDACGRLDLAELPALLSRLSAYVGVDSGITYMADALDIPLVSVAGPCNMAETRPLGRQVVILQRELPCAPCAHIFKAPYSCHTGTRACTRDIPAEEIAAAASRLLGAADAAATAAGDRG